MFEHESSGADSEDDYVQERPSSSKPKKQKRTKRKDAGEDGESRPVQRKRKRKQPAEEIDLSELPPEQGVLGPLSSCLLVC